MPPYVLLLALLGAAYGAIFYAWQGKSLKDSAYYVGASLVGMIIGQIAGHFLGFDVFMIGPLHLLEASLVAWITLFAARWLHL